ncbi:MAG: family 43 glycosylhydrolase, partial [Velocimicrobium sp.]
MTELGKDLVSYLGKSFYSGDAYFKGYFDNVKVYNRALSKVEVAQEHGVTISGLKGATVDGCQLATSKIDTQKQVLNLYFNKDRSSHTDLSSVLLNLVLEDEFRVMTDLSQGSDITGDGTQVEITANGLTTPQIWTIKGSFITNTTKKLLTYVVSGDTTRTDSLHYAYSTDGENYIPFNNSKAILYATLGTKQMGNPVIFKKADGSYGLIATDNNKSSYVLLYDSMDLIHFENERYVQLNTAGISVTDVECSYDGDTSSYLIYWTGSDGNTYISKTSDFKDFTEPVIDQHKMTPVKGNLPDGASECSVFELSETELDTLNEKFGEIYSTKVSNIEPIDVKIGDEMDKLTDSIDVNYNNGETKTYGITWNQGELDAVDTKTSGTYTVTGTVNTNEYTKTPLIEQRADPYVVKGTDGYYYFTASYPVCGTGDGYDRVILRRATTIAGLATAEEVTLWTADTASTGSYFRYIWAPEMHQIGGSWYIFCTASTSSSNVWGIRPHILKCTGDDIMNPDSWTMLGAMKAKSTDSQAFTDFSLDMTYFTCNGVDYVAWAQKDSISSIFIATIDASNPQQLTSDAVKISSPDYAWESSDDTVNEGPVAIQNNGKLYLAFSASSVDKTYCLGVISADISADLTDVNVWSKNRYPLLTTEDLVEQYGPGHNSYTTDEYGNAVIVYHARPEECANKECAYAAYSPLNDPCRHTRVKQVFFDSEGMPVMNVSKENVLPWKDRTVTATIVVSERDKPSEETTDPQAPYAKSNTKESIGDKKADVVIGDSTNGTVAMQVSVKNSTDADGKITDTVELKEDQAKKVVDTILLDKKDMVTIDLSKINVDEKETSDFVKVVLSKEASAVFSKNKIGIYVKLSQVDVVIPIESIKELGEDGVNITVSDITQAKQLNDSKRILKKLSKGSSMLSTPVDIATNYSSKTQIVIPISDTDVPTGKTKLKQFVASLAVLVEHSDGENRLQKGTIEYNASGKPIAVSIWVDKFSSFTLVQTYLKEKVVKYKTKKSAKKVLTAKFTKAIDKKTVTEDSVYVLDVKGNKIAAKVRVSGKKIIVKPVKKYKAGKTYSVYITNSVGYTNGKTIAKAKRYVFTIKK